MLKGVYERMWPKVTCTAPALAKHLTRLVNAAREQGFYIGGKEDQDVSDAEHTRDDEAQPRRSARPKGHH